MENLVDQIIKNILDDSNFDASKYNPITNLKWNERDKQWINHKLYNNEGEPQYPDLCL